MGDRRSVGAGEGRTMAGIMLGMEDVETIDAFVLVAVVRCSCGRHQIYRTATDLTQEETYRLLLEAGLSIAKGNKHAH